MCCSNGSYFRFNMTGSKPHNFEFHKYLQKILGVNQPEASFFIATESDFANSDSLDYPYRSYFYVIGLMHKGNDKIQIGINDYDLDDKTLSVVGPGIIRYWKKNDWAAINHTIFFKAQFFEPPFYNNFLIDYLFFKPGATHALKLIDEDYKKLVEIVRLMQLHVGDKRVLQGLLFSYLECIKQIYSVVSSGIGNSTRNQKISNQFSQLLHHHYQNEKDVKFYADKLNFTPKNLSDILKKETGNSAKQIIEEFVTLEAKSLLKQTSMSVKEIVYWLGYEDPSYFSKFFKSKVGITPLEYRNQ